jgi:hypothetical protein
VKGFVLGGICVRSKGILVKKKLSRDPAAKRFLVSFELEPTSCKIRKKPQKNKFYWFPCD